MEEYLKGLDENLIYKYCEKVDNTYYIYCETNTQCFKHPTLDLVTYNVKDRYVRKIDDLSFCGSFVKLVVTCKRFAFYDLNETYSEKLDFVSDYNQRSRRTKRLDEYVLDVANNGNSNATEKTLKRNGVNISDTTINRLILSKKKPAKSI